MMFETDRLLVRKIESKDLADVVEYGVDVETAQYMICWPRTEGQIRQFIEVAQLEMSKDAPARYEYVLDEKGASKVIGNITIRIEGRTAEIGWISVSGNRSAFFFRMFFC